MEVIVMTFCMLRTAGELSVDETLVTTCIQRTIGREAWKKEVDVELTKWGMQDNLRMVKHFNGPYYDKFVEGRLRTFFTHIWDHEDRLWYVSDGNDGRPIMPGDRISLTVTVRKIGRNLSKEIRKGDLH